MDTQTPKQKAFPIALAQEDEMVRIMACRAGKGMMRKLRDMGVPIGAEVRVVQHKGSGVVLATNATRIALGTSAAQLVYVELVNNDLACSADQCVVMANAVEESLAQ
ncbi:MAG: FeoA domain-containing protein [Magnetovibrio sp.]|nr:FeoA domain-containing protein [Magnetovibrio sp.]